jgi:hypothetical protein
MSLNNAFPLPGAMPLDQYLHALTRNAGYHINEDEFDLIVVSRPDLLIEWITAGSRYAAADYALHLLQRPINWAREEVAPEPGVDTDDIIEWAGWLHAGVAHHQRLVSVRDTALRDFERACAPLLAEGLLERDGIRWQPGRLIPDGLSETVAVRVAPAQHSASLVVLAPWPVLATLAAANLQPTAARPVVRASWYGFNRLDADGRVSRLLARRDDWFFLDGFAWRPAAGSAAEAPLADPSPGEPTAA